MGRKVFISFLGTNAYVPCNYISPNRLSTSNIKYVQEATIKHHCLDFDKFYFFLTDEAKDKNWLPDDGLFNKLRSFLKEDMVFSKHIPNGFTSEEIWKIFEIVYKEIEPQDELVFDITHAFRSLPMLGMVLINYLKAVKKVQIKGIYYGAFEALGPVKTVLEIPVEKRNVQILDLTSFSVLQDWVLAANNFYEFGNVEKLTLLAKNEINPILVDTEGKDINASNIRDLIDPLSKLFDDINTVRAKELYKGEKYKKIKNALKKLKKSVIPQLNPIIQELEKMFMPLKEEDDIINGFHIVKWCIEFGYIQQAYTLLIETVVSYVLFKEGLDWNNLNNRQILNSCFNIFENKTPENKWTGIAACEKETTLKLLSSPYMVALSNIIVSLIDVRNDVNHAGLKENSRSSKKLKDQINKLYCEIISKLQ